MFQPAFLQQPIETFIYLAFTHSAPARSELRGERKGFLSVVKLLDLVAQQGSAPNGGSLRVGGFVLS